jgi:hypothetical protein
MKLFKLEIICNRRRSIKQARLGFGVDSVLIKRDVKAFILMSDRVSKELSTSAKGLSESRQCFIELYIDN